MCEENIKTMSAEEQFKLFTGYFQHEGGLFWSRSNYFMVANTIILGFTFNLIESLQPGLSTKAFIATTLCIVGLVLLFIWKQANAAGIFWNYHWRTYLNKIEPYLFSEGNHPFNFEPTGDYPKRVKAMQQANHLLWVFLVSWILLLIFIMQIVF